MKKVVVEICPKEGFAVDIIMVHFGKRYSNKTGFIKRIGILYFMSA